MAGALAPAASPPPWQRSGERASQLLWQLPGEAVSQPDAERKNALSQQLQSAAINWQASPSWLPSPGQTELRWYDGEVLVGRLGLATNQGQGRIWWCDASDICQVAEVPEAVVRQALQTLGVKPGR
jgi:hypothetical protein